MSERFGGAAETHRRDEEEQIASAHPPSGVPKATWTCVGSGLSTAGVVVARDRADQLDDWYDPIGLVATGIGPLAGQAVLLAGLAGGGLALGTADGWQVGRYPVDWPDEHVILEPPDAGVLWPGHESGCARLLGPDTPHEIRAVGFSRTGRLLVIATAGEVTLYTR